MLTTHQKVLAARVLFQLLRLGRRLVGRDTRARVRRRGFAWDLDLSQVIDLSIYVRGSFEPENLRAYEQVVKPGHVVLDVGANVGSHTLPLARLVGSSGRVVACEPTDWAFARLRTNLSLNPDLAAQVTPVQAMLVRPGQAREAALYSSWPLEAAQDLHEGHHGRRMTTDGAEAVTLDALVERLGLARVDVVKLDVDGHEHHVLAGAGGTLRRWGPEIVIELAPYAYEEGLAAFDETIDRLRAAGYVLVEVGSGRPLPVDGPALRQHIRHGAAINAIARSSAPPRALC